MGFFGRLFGTDPAARVEKARRLVEKGEFNEARLLLEENEAPGADDLRRRALDGLVRLNLEEARARFNSGDRQGAGEHLDLARAFGANPEQLKDVRRFGRELRQEAEARAADEAARREAEAAGQIEGDDPLWGLPPDDPRLRYAMLVESWPDDLRPRLAALGADYARAVLLMEDGDHAGAFAALGPFVPQDPVARYDRARAAIGAGNLPAAASDLQTFGDQVGHQRVGATHTAVLLAQVLGRIGRTPDALAMLDRELARGEDVALSATRAMVLEALGRLDEAEKAAEKLLLVAPRDLGLYRLLGRTREAQGNRLGAMQALEGGLTSCCSAHGKCGNQAFDVEAGRMLARLYLEDRLDERRANELLDELSRNVPRPQWEDRYLAALVARNRGDPDARALADRLSAELPAGDRRREWVDAAFA